MPFLRAVICAALLAFTASPSLAMSGPIVIGKPRPTAPGPKPPTSGPVAIGAPGPVVGVGLPAVAVVGGYLWFVRRRAKKRSM
jgi:hypothetical protein